MSIVGYGVYIPTYRIKREEIANVWGGGAEGVTEKSVVGMDEDITTMAVEAARNALRYANLDASELGLLYVASVSSPYIEKSIAAIVTEALGMGDTVSIADFGGSTKAGTTAMQACTDALSSKRARYGMVIATDCQVGKPGDLLEHSLGAGAAAYIVGEDKAIARIEGMHTYVTSYGSTWRNTGEHFMKRHDDVRADRALGYPRQTAKATEGLMEKLGRKSTDYDYVVLHQPDGRVPYIVAKSLGIKREIMDKTSIGSCCGDTGCSSALIGLALALDNAKEGDKILVVSYGSGAGSDAFSLEVLDKVEGKGQNAIPVKHYLNTKEYIDYPKYEKAVRILDVEWLPSAESAYISRPAWDRDKKWEIGLKALKCKNCGSLNFPKRYYCVDCRGEKFEEIPLPRQGKIVTFNLQYIVAVAPEEAPIPVVTARLDGAQGEYGGKISGMMIPETNPEEVDVGMPVELVFRRCGQELGLVRYGYKFKLIKEGG